MRVQIFLILLAAAFFTADAEPFEAPVKMHFPSKVFRSEFDVILEYYTTGDVHRNAYIDLIDSVTFPIQHKEIFQKKYLKIEGHFEIPVKKIMMHKKGCHSYDALFYRKNTLYAFELNKLIPISAKTITYIQYAPIEKTQPSLSIKFFGRDAEDIVSAMLKKNKYLENTYLYHHPNIYLIESPKPEGHILEFAFNNKSPLSSFPDGGVTLLLGQVSDDRNEITIKKTKATNTLLFNTDYYKFQSGGAFGEDAEILGVRMTSVAYISLSGPNGPRLLSDSDLKEDKNCREIKVSWFFDEIKRIDPQLETCQIYNTFLSNMKFQISGLVFQKTCTFSYWVYGSEPKVDFEGKIEKFEYEDLNGESKTFEGTLPFQIDGKLVKYNDYTGSRFFADEKILFLESTDGRRIEIPSEGVLIHNWNQ